MFNVHNDNFWSRDNPHAAHELGYQVRFSVGVWVGIVGNIFVDHHLLPDRLAAKRSSNFLETVLPGLPEAEHHDLQRTGGKMSSSD
jgi:hypothetical protein